jgi:hypothetical protein
MAKNKHVMSKRQVLTFHKELNDLLSKYDLHSEDGKLHLITSKLNFSNNCDCAPECCMTRVVKLPNGQTTVMTFCVPNCP